MSTDDSSPDAADHSFPADGFCVAELGPEQRAWVERYLAVLPRLEALSAVDEEIFDLVTRDLLESRFAQFPVIAEYLRTNEHTFESMAIATPVIEDVLDEIEEGNYLRTDDGYIWLSPDMALTTETLEIAGTALGDRFDLVTMQLSSLDAGTRSVVVDLVFDIVEAFLMDSPGIARYYETACPNPEAAAVIVPLFESVLAALVSGSEPEGR